MKIYTLIFAIIIAAISPYFLAAEDVVLSTGKSYLNMSFYNFDEKTTSTIELKSWDLAFVVAGTNGAIHINSGAGTQLWEVVGKTTEDFDNPIDTTGITTNKDLFKSWQNSDSTWAIGAFNCGMNGFDGSGDFGKGAYIINPNINYVLQTANGIYKLHFIGFYNDAGEKGYPKFEYQLF